jgi:hypothetical protein
VAIDTLQDAVRRGMAIAATSQLQPIRLFDSEGSITPENLADMEAVANALYRQMECMAPLVEHESIALRAAAIALATRIIIAIPPQYRAVMMKQTVEWMTDHFESATKEST